MDDRRPHSRHRPVLPDHVGVSPPSPRLTPRQPTGSDEDDDGRVGYHTRHPDRP